MLQYLPTVLKFAGLSGLGKRGWYVVGGVALLLFSVAAVPAIKAKLPWVGTEAQLKRAKQSVQASQEALALCSAANDANARVMEDLRLQAARDIEEANRRREQAKRIAAEMTAQAKHFEEQRNESRRKLQESLTISSEWSDGDVPAAVVEQLRQAINRSRIRAGTSARGPIHTDTT